MSDIFYIPDHVERALARLVSRFDEKYAPKLRSTVALLTQQVQEAEDTLFDLFWSRTVDGAQGAQLDVIGRFLNEPRDGLGDIAYRRVLKARPLVLFSEGERSRIIEIVRRITGSDDVQFQSNFPAAYIVSYVVPDGFASSFLARVFRNTLDATCSGVGVTVVEAEPDYFGFADDDDALGFDEGVFAGAIGG